MRRDDGRWAFGAQTAADHAAREQRMREAAALDAADVDREWQELLTDLGGEG